MRTCVILALWVIVMGSLGWAQQATQTDSLNVDLDGRKTWTVRFGLGDPLALAGASIGAGQFELDQTLRVDFTATALDIFRVVGHFDDQEPTDMQSLSLYLDTEHVQGVLGDFTAPSLGGFFAGSRTMIGARVDALWDQGSALAIVSQVSGTRASRQFVGELAFGEEVFAGASGDEGVSYATSLRGFGYVDLKELYAEGFTEIRLDLEPGEASAIMTQFGVADLIKTLSAFDGRLVDSHEALVVGEGESGSDTQSLILRVEPTQAVRETLREALRVYNATGSGEALTYPFVSGSGVEQDFLAALVARTALRVGSEARSLGELRFRRFFDLGQERVEPETVRVEVRRDGEYVSTDDPRLSDYSFRVRAAEGLLDVSFPESFFADPDAALRVQFAYKVVGGIYFLGASVIPGSERVVLAGRSLVRDTDYTLDYEFGMLALLVDIGPDEALIVEFERYSGPGGAGAYARTFYGGTISLPVGSEWSFTGYALRASDDTGSVENSDSVKTMPNRQTVVGVSGRWTRPDLSASVDIGYTDDLFPYDDNGRVRTPNEVRAVAAGAGRVVVGTDTGFSVFGAGAWEAYGSQSGLSGREVRAVALDESAVYLGTEGGLTIVRLVGVSPLDKVANWSRYGERQGLLEDSIRALALDGDTLWIGTDAGLSAVPTAAVADPDAWTSYEDAALLGVRALAVAAGALYVGTSEGLVRLDPATRTAERVGSATAVWDLAVHGDVLYAAGAEGLRTVVAGAETEWVIRGEAVPAVEAAGDHVYYAAGDGVARVADGARFFDGWQVTALGAEADRLWVGTSGTGEGELLVGRLSAGEAVYDAATTGIDPWNPRVYTDAPADEHTTTGWMARGSFSHQGDGYSVAASVNRTLPGFRAIDARSRSNDGGWTFASDLDLGATSSLSFTHEVRMSHVGSVDARTLAEQGLTFRTTMGPKLTFAIDYTVEDNAARPGYERSAVAYNVGIDHSFFEKALELSIGWDERVSWSESLAPRRDTTLSTRASLDILPGVETSWTWRRPVRIVGASASGSDRLTWTTDGAFDAGSLGIAAGYDLTGGRALPGGDVALSHAATLSFTIDPIASGEWSLAPTLDLEGEHEDRVSAVSGRLGARLNGPDMTARATASVDVSGIGSRVVRWTERLTSSFTYSGIADLRPSLNYNATRTVTQVEGQGSKAKTTHTLTGRVSWSGPDGTSETLAATARLEASGAANLSVTNSYSRDITALVRGWMAARGENDDAPARAPSEAEPTADVVDAESPRDVESAPAASTTRRPSAVEAAGFVPTVLLRSDAGGEWRRQNDKDDATWRAGLTADLRLSPTWSLSLGATYRGGMRTAVPPYHGLVLEMTVAIDFER